MTRHEPEMAKMPELLATETDDDACQGLAKVVSERGREGARLAIDTPCDDNKNAFSACRSGGIGRRAGLKIRWR